MGVCVVGGSDRTAGEVRKEKQRESNGRDVNCRNGIEIVQSYVIFTLFFIFFTHLRSLASSRMLLGVERI